MRAPRPPSIIFNVPDNSKKLTGLGSARVHHYILGTAGHIDHGKTSLVRILTGYDTDRLPEERKRGMTIELGFAPLDLGKAQFGIVDVPGHERFVRTMVAGATGIDIALIVVAADDSIMPQTREHVEILHLLGVSQAVVAVTKIDTVDSEMVELVVDDVRELLANTPLSRAPICPVSSTTGAGLDALRQAILDAAREVPQKPQGYPFRMAIDRVFVVQGRGTVVTGSVLCGSVEEGDTLEILPSGLTCRVRGLQSHGSEASQVGHGQRAAINVSGIDRSRIGRGMELATPGYLQPTQLVDVSVTCLESYDKAIKSTQTIRLEIGSGELHARIVLFENRSLPPGKTGFAQLRSGELFAATHGQRFILRDQNSQRTIGGGVVLQPVAKRRREGKEQISRLTALLSGDPADRVEEILRELRFTKPTNDQLCARAAIAPHDADAILTVLIEDGRYVAIGNTGVYATPAARKDIENRMFRWLARFHRENPELPGRPAATVLGWLERLTDRSIARALFEGFERDNVLKRLGKFVGLTSFAPKLSGADEKWLAAMVAEIKQGGFQPPLVDVLSSPGPADRKRRDRLLILATAFGDLVPIAPKLYLHADYEAALREKVAALIQSEDGVTVAQVREALDSSRKYVIPFLEYLDRVNFTKRSGDVRVLL